MKYIRVCSLADLPPGSQKIVECSAHKVVLFHFDNEISAIANACLHKAGPLGLGLVEKKIRWPLCYLSLARMGIWYQNRVGATGLQRPAGSVWSEGGGEWYIIKCTTHKKSPPGTAWSQNNWRPGETEVWDGAGIKKVFRHLAIARGRSPANNRYNHRKFYGEYFCLRRIMSIFTA